MDKIEKLLDAIEHPEHFSDRELDELLNDPEVKDAYDVLTKTRSSLNARPEPNVDAEWASFKHAHSVRRFSISKFVSRNIAASIAIGIISLAAVATAVGVSVYHLNNTNTETATTNVATTGTVTNNEAKSSKATNDISSPKPGTVVFDNENFETIISQIAAYHNMSVNFKSDASKSLRLYFSWNQSLPIDEVIDNLNNFEHIHLAIKNNQIIID